MFSELEAEAYAADGGAAASQRGEVFTIDGIPSSAASVASPEEDEAAVSALPQQPWAVWGLPTSSHQADLAVQMDFSRAWAPIVTPARRSLDGVAATNRRVAQAASESCGEGGNADVAEALSRALEERLRLGELQSAGSFGDMPIALAEQVCFFVVPLSTSSMMPCDGRAKLGVLHKQDALRLRCLHTSALTFLFMRGRIDVQSVCMCRCCRQAQGLRPAQRQTCFLMTCPGSRIGQRRRAAPAARSPQTSPSACSPPPPRCRQPGAPPTPYRFQAPAATLYLRLCALRYFARHPHRTLALFHPAACAVAVDHCPKQWLVTVAETEGV